MLQAISQWRIMQTHMEDFCTEVTCMHVALFYFLSYKINLNILIHRTTVFQPFDLIVYYLGLIKVPLIVSHSTVYYWS